MRPVLIDAYSGTGGASMGYHRVGFEVIGIDIKPQPRYPFRFICADVPKLDLVTLARDLGAVVLAGSPPCKVRTTMKAFSSAHHTDLLPGFREQCIATGLPYIIENVPPSPDMIDPVTLCGSSFDLGVLRHRLFESNMTLTAPACDHEGQAARSPGYPVKRYHSGSPVITMSPVIGCYGRGQGLGPGEVELWKQAMGIDWMTRDEMAQAIPPAYTEHLGRQIMAQLQAVAA
jgi:DNA (cytosine-5)-methyltransferase 1